MENLLYICQHNNLSFMKYIVYIFSLVWLTCLFASCSSKHAHFISDSTYRARVEQDFQQKQVVMSKGNLFAIFDTDLTLYEREALEFLYAYMPLADITDYSGGFHLMNVQAAHRASEEMPWGRMVSEELFRHFVLPVRVNNEPLDSARVVFYEELKPRVQHLSMRNAILEVNHWCHEKAVYQPSDARTSSPLATVRTAYGRCGEESTFLVAALRSVGIPARQVYTPRWAHTDDNHAWVEAWADGKWYFLGACEPEPVLNLGWFNAPASRGMLMHTKVFGRYEGPEEVMSVTPNYTEINVIDNYAPTAQATVTVTDEAGQPVSGALVEFKLYNYAEFYTVARKVSDAVGVASLTAGKGDMLVWASKNGRFGFQKLSFGKQDALTVTLDHQDGDTFELDMDIVPPVESANLPEVTPEQRAENDRRMAEEDSIRNAYIATMMTPEKARAWVDQCYGTTLQPAAMKEKVAALLVASRGNHATLTTFLSGLRKEGAGQPKGDRHIVYKELKAIDLLTAISEKDLRDVKLEVLEDHLAHTAELPGTNVFNADLQTRYLLNPRVATEELTPYKSFFQRVIDEETAAAYRQQPKQLVEWCKNNIVLNDTLNSQRIPMSPEGVWNARMADTYSRDIFFVAVARSLGIPAWIDEVTGTVCYLDLANDSNLKNGKLYHVDFNMEGAQTVSPSGSLAATFQPTKFIDNPKYYSHFTLSRCEDGVLRLQSYDEANASWSTLLRRPLQMPAGYYVLVSGTRLASGGVLVHMSGLNVKAGETLKTALTMRESEDQIQVIGNFNSESLFTPVTDGEVAGEPVSVLAACGRGYFVVGVLGVGQEPTNHALKDIEIKKDEFEKWGRKIVLLFTDEESYKKFDKDDFPNLPSTICFGIDTNGNIRKQIAEAMKLKNNGHLPIFIIGDTFNRVVFESDGYTIGLGEQLIHTIKGL